MLTKPKKYISKLDLCYLNQKKYISKLDLCELNQKYIYK